MDSSHFETKVLSAGAELGRLRAEPRHLRMPNNAPSSST